MRCPTCSTEVPEARFCARCGDRLTDAHSAPPATADPATRHFFHRYAEEVSSSVWGWWGAAAVAIVVAATVAAVWAGSGPPGAVDDGEITLPAAAGLSPAPAPAASPFVPSPSATVLCSDLSEHRVKYAWLDDADIGDTVDVHGTPCIVSAIDADARPQDYPRGVARGNRPGVGPRR